MKNKIYKIKNEFRKAVDTAEENLFVGKSGSFTMNCSYAEGIFYAMCCHGKMNDLPKDRLGKLCAYGNLIANFNIIREIMEVFERKEWIRIAAKMFESTMKDDSEETTLSSFAVAKGIIFVMQELGTLSNLDQHLVDVHRGMTRSMMELMEANDGFDDFINSFVHGLDPEMDSYQPE